MLWQRCALILTEGALLFLKCVLGGRSLCVTRQGLRKRNSGFCCQCGGRGRPGGPRGASPAAKPCGDQPETSAFPCRAGSSLLARWPSALTWQRAQLRWERVLQTPLSRAGGGARQGPRFVDGSGEALAGPSRPCVCPCACPCTCHRSLTGSCPCSQARSARLCSRFGLCWQIPVRGVPAALRL